MENSTEERVHDLNKKNTDSGFLSLYSYSEI